MALKFLNKKGWHTGSLRNIENVWKAEQKHEAEQKKLEELRKQIQEEREKDEFRQLQEQAGLVPRQERLEFLYDSGLAVGRNNNELFPLSRPDDPAKNEQASQEKKDQASSLPGALFSEEKPFSANDTWRKLHSDPLLTIRQREQEALAKIKNNPVKMEMIKKSILDQNGETKEKKSDRKDQKKKSERKSRHKEKRKKEYGSSDYDTDSAYDKQRKTARKDLNKEKRKKGLSDNHSDSAYDSGHEDTRNGIKGKHQTEQSKESELKFRSSVHCSFTRRSRSRDRDRHSRRDRSQSPSGYRRRRSRSPHSVRHRSRSVDRSSKKGRSRSPLNHRRQRSRSPLKQGRYRSLAIVEGSFKSHSSDQGASLKREYANYNQRDNNRNRLVDSLNTANSGDKISTACNQSRQRTQKLSEEERAARLREMQVDAELHEEQRWRRLKRASDADAKEATEAARGIGKNFLDVTKKNIYGAQKGDTSTIEESIRRRVHYSQGSSAEGNAFRR
eukprot:TRINITY_DN2608_c0_g1_i1.p1 TRINITY_DN2608_c0_g1~~TRINITY_DN2608_c0_g1_i1.p1  ORF type:complete len:502 (-),score=90.78 TRINITY_DN2608_c0_g1_i1:162-1667(-)